MRDLRDDKNGGLAMHEEPYEGALVEGHGTMVTRQIGALAMSLDDLRAVAARVARLGDYQIRRFGKDYADLDGFLEAHEAPYRTVDFVLTDLEIRLSARGSAVVHTPEAASKAEELVGFLEQFRESPLVEYRYLHGLLLFAATFVFIEQRQYAMLLVLFVVAMMFFHLVDSSRRRTPVFRRGSNLFAHPGWSFVFLGAAVILAALLGALF